MPLYEYQCQSCSGLIEIFVRSGESHPEVVRCAGCGSEDTARTVSRFSFKTARPARYSESFRERVAPFLKSRPGAAEYFARGGESEEAKIHALTERIGERIDGVLQDHVFKNLET